MHVSEQQLWDTRSHHKAMAKLTAESIARVEKEIAIKQSPYEIGDVIEGVTRNAAKITKLWTVVDIQAAQWLHETVNSGNGYYHRNYRIIVTQDGIEDPFELLPSRFETLEITLHKGVSPCPTEK